MADLIEYFDKLNAERARLSLYGRRLRKVKWLVPSVVKGLMRDLDEEWREVSAERQKVLAVIWADPALRTRMQEREKAAVAEAKLRLVAPGPITMLPGRPYEASLPVKELGRKVVALEREELRRQHDLDEVYFYYGSSAWQNEGVEIAKLDKLIQNCELDRDTARLAHHRLLDGLHTRVQLEAANGKPVSMICSDLLGSIRAEIPKSVPENDTPLVRFLEKERPVMEVGNTVRRSKVPTR